MFPDVPDEEEEEPLSNPKERGKRTRAEVTTRDLSEFPWIEKARAERNRGDWTFRRGDIPDVDREIRDRKRAAVAVLGGMKNKFYCSKIKD